MMIDITLMITVVVLVVVMGVAVMLLTPIRILIQNRASKENYEMLLELADISVRWAKQWLDSESGAKKKEEVIEYLKRRCDAIGISVSEEDIDKAIESSYEKIKKEL